MCDKKIFAFIIILLFSCFLFGENRSATVSGYCFINAAGSHEGSKVKFKAVSVSAVTDSTFTGADGSFQIGLTEGIYDIIYSHYGCGVFTNYSVEIFSDTVLDDVTIYPGSGIQIIGSQSGVWYSGLEYQVTGDIFIEEGNSLEIESGVTVTFMDYYSFDVYGTLIAEGTLADSIVFTSGQIAPSDMDWNEIHFYPSASDDSFFSAVKFEYAKYGLYLEEASPSISDCSFENNHYGIYCENNAALIQYNTFIENTYAGVYLDYFASSLSDNYFSYNDNAIVCDHAQAQIYNSYFHQNDDAVIDVSASSVEVFGNLFTENITGLDFTNSSSICLYNNTFASQSSAIECHLSQADIFNNIFYENETAITFNITPSSSEISYNLFWLNGEDFSGISLPPALGNIVTINANGDPTDTYYNLYLNPGNLTGNNYELSVGSPAIDAGDPDSLYFDPDETISDIGFDYLFQNSEPPQILSFSVDESAGNVPLTVQFVQETMYPVTGYTWTFGDGDISTLANPVHTYNQAGDYSVTLEVTGPGGSDSVTYPDYINAASSTAPLEAVFAAEPLLGVVPLNVDFINVSTGNIEEVLWSFGDGTTSTDFSPTRQYNVPGVYTVTLTVYDESSSSTETKTDYIEVLMPQPVEASFAYSTDFGSTPLTVEFTNTSTGSIFGYLWEFGDGSSSSQTNPVHVYEEPGIYEAVLNVTGLSNSDTVSHQFTAVTYQPVILEISDIPEDQGGWVNVHFFASMFDNDPLYRPAEGYTVEIETEAGWTGVNSCYAYGNLEYNILAATPYDSTESNSEPINFRVIAAMDEGNYVSEPMTGYSLDNIAPQVPSGLLFDSTNLIWNPAFDEDFAYFTVYLDYLPIATTINPVFDIEGLYGLFQVSATDSNGNESILSEALATETAYGDINDNGEIEAYDASLVLMYVVGLDPLPEDPLPWEFWRLQRADVNIDGSIEAIDGAIILQYIVGLIDELPYYTMPGQDE